MASDIEALRAGLTPIHPDAVQYARERIAPPPIELVQALYGGATVGASHPLAKGETRVDDRPPIKLGAKPSSSVDSPPDVPQAPAKAAAAAVAYKSGVRYAVRLKGPVLIEKDFELSPDRIHYMDGALVEKHKAQVDDAVEAP